MKNRDKDYIKIVPTARQMLHQKMEFYAFFHFSINTFTDREWGDGTESPKLFHPMSMDAGQWTRAIKEAGMKGAILTCKHHDGFCLWPSKYTDYTIAASPYKEGKGDIVREVSEALKQEGLAFGIYLSPWDRNQKTYGTGTLYDQYYVNQLTELLTGYGEIFAVWLDGACGENREGKVQHYDWEWYYSTIRQLQPNACICVCGEDVRWCGNEAGDTRESEWSVVPKILADAEKTAEKSQKSDDNKFRMKQMQSTERDLGSRMKLEGEQELIWYPSEVNTSIRPGWFYHEEEDTKVKSLETLVSIYERSVGGNATFLLNIPPTREGRIHRNDVNRLKELGDYIKSTYTKNLLTDSDVLVKRKGECRPINEIDKNGCLYSTKEGENSLELVVSFPEIRRISRVVLMEKLEYSQRIEAFSIMAKIEGRQEEIYRGTTVGYKKIAIFKSIETEEIILKILDSRVSIYLEFFGIYK